MKVDSTGKCNRCQKQGDLYHYWWDHHNMERLCLPCFEQVDEQVMRCMGNAANRTLTTLYHMKGKDKPCKLKL